jgi:hypothetical protein
MGGGKVDPRGAEEALGTNSPTNQDGGLRRLRIKRSISAKVEQKNSGDKKSAAIPICSSVLHLS